MNEAHFSEIERVLLYVSEAREFAAKAHAKLTRGDAEPHLIAALAATEEAMRQEHRRLMHTTFYAVTPDQGKLAV